MKRNHNLTVRKSFSKGFYFYCKRCHNFSKASSNIWIFLRRTLIIVGSKDLAILQGQLLLLFFLALLSFSLCYVLWMLESSYYVSSMDSCSRRIARRVYTGSHKDPQQVPKFKRLPGTRFCFARMTKHGSLNFERTGEMML